jgi:hypothetical protein
MSNSFWRIDRIFSNVSGFTPYSRLNDSTLVSGAFFPRRREIMTYILKTVPPSTGYQNCGHDKEAMEGFIP